MKSFRQEFKKAVKEAAFERSAGHCECGCGEPHSAQLIYGHWPIPAALGGPGTLENCRVHNLRCELRMTSARDRPAIDKAKRGLEKRLGLRESRYRPLGGTRKSGWRKKMDGTVERRERE